MNLTHRYAAWCRRQASTTNCGHAAGGGLFLLAVAALVIAAYWAVIWPVLVVIFWAVVATAGLCVLAVIGWGIAATAVARRRRAARPAPAPRPLCQDCGVRPATAEVTYANGRRSDTAPTCDQCWREEEARAAVPPEWTRTPAVSRLPAYREIPPPAWPGPGPVRLPDADAEVPVAPDNRPAADPATAADLAAVLGRTGQWRRSHP